MTFRLRGDGFFFVSLASERDTFSFLPLGLLQALPGDSPATLRRIRGNQIKGVLPRRHADIAFGLPVKQCSFDDSANRIEAVERRSAAGWNDEEVHAAVGAFDQTLNDSFRREREEGAILL